MTPEFKALREIRDAIGSLIIVLSLSGLAIVVTLVVITLKMP